MQKPKGTKDVFGFEQNLKKLVISTLNEIASLNNFEEIETPIFEHRDVFFESVGETSDIVSKEMYQFKDQGSRDLVLRPEGTAPIIRAIVENKLFAKPLPLKLFYQGPMFRYENPQKGRQRQFNQFGVEVLGEKSPYLDAEVILMAASILDAFKISYQLKINFLGNQNTLKKWSETLTNYFKKYEKQLSPISQKRLYKNPMRILDDKIDSKHDFVKNAPQVKDFYSEEDKAYFQTLQTFLKNIGLEFTIDYKLVRGLDYYSDTAFEFVSTSKDAGAQSTLIGGGRYNNLMKKFKGPDLSGIGFGLGIERFILELKNLIRAEELEESVQVYVINLEQKTTAAALGIVYMLRKSGIKTAWNYQPTKLLKAFNKADKIGAKIKIIAGTKELKNNQVTVKFKEKQELVTLENLVSHLTKKLD